MGAEAASRERIDFVVGSDLCLDDVLSGSDVRILLKALVAAGLTRAAVTDETGSILWAEGENSGDEALPEPVRGALKAGIGQGPGWRSAPFRLEGELRGFVYLGIPDSMGPELSTALISLASATVDIALQNTVKRLLTTQVHTSAVHQSYEELLETNRKLTVSRDQYEELSRTLQQRVEERTAELKKAHTRLLQQEKMACIGQLAAGVAHEVNTPLNYLSGNIRALSTYVEELHTLLQRYREALKQAPSGRPALERLEELYRRVDVPYIVKDTVDLARESLEGTNRIGKIVANLKGFSHVDEIGTRSMNLNEEIERTLEVLVQTRRGSPPVTIDRKYGRIPDFHGSPALISQVFLNVLTNAFQSRAEGLAVAVETACPDGEIVVSITDNGKGIPDEIRNRIFEPFFTTKDVGEGTGMGLAVAYDIVTNHKGRIAVHSDPGRGTRVDIVLPAAIPSPDRSEPETRTLEPNGAADRTGAGRTD